MPEQVDWSFWDIVVALLLGIITISWTLREYFRNRKHLVYNVLSSFPLIHVNENAANRIKVLFDEKPIANVFMTILKIVNKGSPIGSRDFESPLIFSMGEDAHIISAVVFETSPNDLSVALSVDDDKIQIAPLLLNATDSITIKVIGANLMRDRIEVAGRILGVKEIKRGDTEATMTQNALAYLLLFSFGISLLAGMGAGIAKFFKLQHYDLFRKIMWASFVIFSILLTVMFIILNFATRKKKNRFA